ncbi:carbohydrate kinaes [Weissella oryzae SG25]|uniref:ADP-dependent (S)-NAD(P)H-hydrate dehydratase n=1 Tax=Weissella oryzae (strain DSM 25784 / JCM 18191 / LMG 30913 / SG25) TaxID=1329250 RepID=A0A069CUK7_WEIOS|nr:NAD(P)H-hydrate dehydratase [Weissella oryzae]GAK30903.1 carbohydrate kinaes [Weissella oryzae SG25]
MTEELTSTIVHEIIQKRPVAAHKGNFGRVLVIAGNPQFGGAGIMAATAAINAGAGLVTLATDPINFTALHSRTPEAMVIDWHDDAQLALAIEQADVILIGPGLGTDELAVHLVKKTFTTIKTAQKLVVDGSALKVMAENNLVFPLNIFSVATPHQGEWEVLSGIKLSYQDNLSLNNVQRSILNINVLVLKQHHTLIMSELGEFHLGIGGPYMAVGGMGDTLAGIIAAFIAQFPNAIKATEAAVYVHSAIADQMAQHSYIVKPSIIADFLPNYMARIKNNLVEPENPTN